MSFDFESFGTGAVTALGGLGTDIAFYLGGGDVAILQNVGISTRENTCAIDVYSNLL